MLTRSIQDFISNSKINWSQKSIEINRNFENFCLLFSTSKRHLFEKLFLTGWLRLYRLVRNIWQFLWWCSARSFLVAVYQIRNNSFSSIYNFWNLHFWRLCEWLRYKFLIEIKRWHNSVSWGTRGWKEKYPFLEWDLLRDSETSEELKLLGLKLLG